MQHRAAISAIAELFILAALETVFYILSLNRKLIITNCIVNRPTVAYVMYCNLYYATEMLVKINLHNTGQRPVCRRRIVVAHEKR